MASLRRSPVAPGAAMVVAVVAALAAVSPAAARDAGGGPRVLSARHAIVTAPDASSPGGVATRTLTPDQGCQALLDAGAGDCAVVQTAHGQLVFTVEKGAPIDDVLVSRPWIIRVYRPSPTVPDGWDLALSTTPQGTDPGPLYANVTAKVADVTGDGGDELVLGYRSEGTGQILDFDVVGTAADGTPTVLAHDQLYKGTVVVGDGHLVTYEPVYRRTDANCCPTWIVRSTVRYHGGEFEVRPGPRVPTKRADVPPGDLG
jgi:hypothetical protein